MGFFDLLQATVTWVLKPRVELVIADSATVTHDRYALATVTHDRKETGTLTHDRRETASVPIVGVVL